jgi:formiminotetrahydrofolate cyclodeaminase
VNEIHVALVAVGLILTIVGMVTKAQRNIIKDNTNTAAALTKTITSEVSSLRLALNSVQEKHAAAVEKVDDVVMPHLEDLETRMRRAEQGQILQEFLESLGRHSNQRANAKGVGA